MSSSPSSSSDLNDEPQKEDSSLETPSMQERSHGTAFHEKILSAKPNLSSRLHLVPHKPGVYLMRDRLNRVIYAGKARDLRKRLSHYFTPSRARQADLKTRSLIESIWNFEWHVVRNETEALLLEGRLIKEYRPRYNIAFRDDKRFLQIRVQHSEAFPRLQFTRLKKEDGAKYYGPFAHAGALRTTIDWLNRRFGLRTCRPVNPTETNYRHCNDDVIRNCSAPCINRINSEEYHERIQQACALLEGKSSELITGLKSEMEQAAQNLDFETAAGLRDLIKDLEVTFQPVRTFSRASQFPHLKSLNPEDDARELAEWLGLERPLRYMECFDISNISTAHCVASMVRFKDGKPDSENYRRFRIRAVNGQNDFVSMAEVVRRRYSRLLAQIKDVDLDAAQDSAIEVFRREAENIPGVIPLPDLIIVDGGKGQLGMAVEELQRLGLWMIPVIGLAKELEAVFRPGESEPLLIPHDRGALKLLQRIRDESHRVANGYHQLLMRRRVQESLLDDIPGVSAARKTALLKEFGSVARIRKLTPEQLCQVRGISRALADEILATLRGK